MRAAQRDEIKLRVGLVGVTRHLPLGARILVGLQIQAAAHVAQAVLVHAVQRGDVGHHPQLVVLSLGAARGGSQSYGRCAGGERVARLADVQKTVSLALLEFGECLGVAAEHRPCCAEQYEQTCSK